MGFFARWVILAFACTLGIALPASARPFVQGHSPWNTRLISWPRLAANDRTKIDWLRAQGLGNFFWSPRVSVPYDNAHDESIPIYHTTVRDPLVRLTCFETYLACPFAGRTIRMPAKAMSQGAGRGDAHLVSIQPSGAAVELYEVRTSGDWKDGHTYRVGFGGIVQSLASGDGWHPAIIANAAGASLFGGAVTAAELARGPGGIRHALAVSTPCGGNTSIYPALGHAQQRCRHDDPQPEQDIPLGAHLWFDLTHAQIDRLGNMVHDQKTVLYALHDYGAYVEDTNANQFTLNVEWTPVSQAPAIVAGTFDALGARAAANMRYWYTDITGRRIYHLTSDNITEADGSAFDLLAHLHVLDPCESHNPRRCSVKAPATPRASGRRSYDGP